MVFRIRTIDTLQICIDHTAWNSIWFNYVAFIKNPVDVKDAARLQESVEIVETWQIQIAH